MALVIALMASCGSDDKQTSSQEPDESSVTEQLTDDTLGDIFKEASEIGDGTAGVSLKRTQIAAKIASYAAVIGFTNDSVESLKEEMLAKYNALDDQGKENLDNAFMDAIQLLDKAIDDGDYDSVKGQFEDAGAAEGFDTVLKAPGLKESYDTFKSAYLTMGNSED